MTDLRAQTLERLDYSSGSRDIAKAKGWLLNADPRPLSDRPLEVRAHDVLELWRVRLKISMSKGHTLEGAPELLANLETLHPLVKLEQIGFAASELMANIFFQKASGAYVGSVLFTAPKLRERLRRPS